MKRLLLLLFTLLIAHTSLNAQYCEPTSSNRLMGISRVVVGNIFLNSSINTGYQDNTHITTQLNPGQAYSLWVYGRYQAQWITAWIDYNGDETFTEDERLGYTQTFGYRGNSIAFTVPATGLANGYTRIRVKSEWSNLSANLGDACTNLLHGETEDYGVYFYAPTVVTQNISVNLDADGNATITPEMIDNGSTDPGGSVTLSLNQSSFTCANVGVNTVTLVATNAGGISASATATVTIVDNQAPVIALSGASEIDILQSTPFSDPGVQVTDNCSTTVNITGSVDSSTPSSYLLTYQATDAGSNLSNSVQRTVNVLSDAVSPQVVTQGVTVVLDASGQASVNPAEVDNGSSDNVGLSAEPFSMSQTEFTCADVGAKQVTLTVTDVNGNQASANATVTVVDDQVPTISLNGATSINHIINTAFTDPGVTGEDNCSLQVITTGAVNVAQLGVYTLDYKVVDPAGNESVTVSRTVNVMPVDTEMPQVTTKNINVYLDASGNASITPEQVDNGSTDNFGLAADPFSLDVSTFDCADLGDQVVVLTVTDFFGNTATSTATVTVVDNTGPVMSGPSDISAAIDTNINGATVTYTFPTATDNCALASITQVSGLSSGAVFPLGATLNVFEATDVNGNKATYSFNVTVTPEYCELPFNAHASYGINQVIVSGQINQSSTFNTTYQDFTNLNINATPGSGFSLYVRVPRNYRYSVWIDLNGNGVFEDSERRLTNAFPNRYNTVFIPSTGITTRTTRMRIKTDANFSFISVPCQVYWGEAEDYTITFTSPTAITKTFTAELDSNGEATIAPEDVNDGSTAGSGSLTLNLDKTDFSCADLGDQLVTLTATSSSGISDQATAIVKVVDRLAPEISITGDATVYHNAFTAYTVAGAIATDNCSTPTVLVNNPVNVNAPGTYTVTYTTEDASGNAATTTRTVIVQDVTAPTVATQDITVQLDASGTASITTAQIDNNSSDDSGVVSLSLDQSTFDCTDASNFGLDLDGADDWVNVGDLGMTSGTLALWLKADDTGSERRIWGQVSGSEGNGGSALGISPGTLDGGGTPGIYLWDGTIWREIADLQSAWQGEWHHLAIVFDAGEATAYWDGVAQNTITTNFHLSGVELGLGQRFMSQYGTPFEGEMDEFSAWSTALSQSEIQSLMTTSPVGTEPGLISYYNFDNPKESSLTDATGRFDATLQNVDTNSAWLQRPISIKLTATDAAGNTASAMADVLVQDVTKPVLTLNGDNPLYHNAFTDFTDPGASATDNCSAELTSDKSVDKDVPGTYTITYTATDPSGNDTQATRTVIVQDVTAPTAIANDLTITLDASGNASITTDQVDAGSTDDSGTVSLSLSPTDFTCADASNTTIDLDGDNDWINVGDLGLNSGTLALWLKADDTGSERRIWGQVSGLQGNAGSALGISPGTLDGGGIPGIYVWDGTIWKEIADLQTAWQGEWHHLAIVFENGEATAYWDGVAQNTVVTNLHLSGVELGLGQRFVSTFGRHFDGEMDEFSAWSRALTVTEIQALITDEPSANANGLVAYYDFEEGIGTQLANRAGANNPGILNNIDEATAWIKTSTEVTLTTTDPSGNSATATANIVVQDNIAPTISLIGNAVQTLDYGTAYTEAGATSTDNCSSTVTIGGDAVNTNQVGSYTITYQATDNAGNSSPLLTRTVNVVDNVAPVINTTDLTVNNDPGQCGATIASFNASATDNAGTANLSFDLPEGSLFNVGTTTVNATATDASGNQTQDSFTINVIDNEAPNVAAQNISVTLTASGTVSITPQDVLAGGSDNCGAVNYAISQDTFGAQDALNSPVVVELTGTDASNNTTTVHPSVTVIDPVPEVITQNITVALDANGNANITAQQIDDGSNSVVGLSGLALDITSFTCDDLGVNTVTLTATSTLGSTASGTATVTVIDNENPVITINGAASITHEAYTPYTDGGATATDNCTATLATDNPVDINTPSTYTVTYTATDASGNTAQLTRTVTVADSIDPELTVTNINVTTDAGVCGAVVNAFGATASDASGVANITYDQLEGISFPVGETTVNATATDVNGNMTSKAFTINVVDDENPAITINGAASVTHEAYTAYSDAGASATDNCSATLATDNPVDITTPGTYTVTYTAADASGNPAQLTRTVTVVDSIDPELTVTDINVTTDAGACGAIINAFGATASDASGVANINYDFTEGSSFAVGTTTVNATATDANGNTNSKAFTITVVDDENPVITINGEASVTHEAYTPYSDAGASATDNCSATLATDNPVDITTPVTYTVTYTATDASGNTAQLIRTVTVADSIDPELTVTNINMTTDTGGCGAIINAFGATASDASGVANITYDQLEGNSFPVGTTTVNATATDANGNTTSKAFTITVVDDENPVITINGAASITHEAYTPYSDAGATATDNCTATLATDNPVDITTPGTYTVTYTATDASGNPAQLTRTVNVVDSIDPELTVTDINMTTDAGACGAIINAFGATASDASGVANITYDQLEGNNFPVGETTVNATATDANGNSTSDSFTITVVDDEAPHIITRPITVALNGNGEYAITSKEIDGGTTDNCGFTLSLDNNAFNCGTLGENTVMLTATDASGNSATAPAIVIVIDNAAPTIVTNPITVQLDANGQVNIMASQVDGGTYDNCAVASVTIDTTSFNCEDLGDNTVTITATDVNGNVSTAPVNVEVIDIIAPTVGTRDVTVELDANGQASISPEEVLILSEDDVETGEDCTASAAQNHAVWLSQYVKKKSDKKKGRGWGWGWWKNRQYPQNTPFVFDANGGSFSKNLDGTATVTGTIRSTADAEDLWIVSLKLENASTWEEWTAMGRKYKREGRYVRRQYKDWAYYEMADGSKLIGAGKNEGEEIALSHAPANYRYGFQLGEAANLKNADFGLSGWFFYKNRQGRMVKGDFNLNVNDCGAQSIPEGTVITSDNCSLDSFTLNQSTFTCKDLGETTVEVTVTDRSGNATTETAVVTVKDKIAPVAVAQNITVSLGADGTVSVDPQSVNGGSTDNTDCELTYSLSRTDFSCRDIGKGQYYYSDDNDDDETHRGWWGKKKDKGKRKKGHKVTMTVTDAAGNTDHATAYITIVDDLAPTISQEPITIVVYDRKREYLRYEDVNSKVDDNCRVRGFWFPWTRFDKSDIGMNTVKVKAWDYSGNTTIGTVNVEVIDISRMGRYVQMCYRGRSKWVKKYHVQKYIRRGAKIGSCGADLAMGTGGNSFAEAMERAVQTEPLIELGVYPNPSAGITTITFSSEIAGPATIGVIAPNGNRMATLFDGDIAANENVTLKYNTADLPSGVYIVRLVTAGEIRNLKLMVRK